MQKRAAELLHIKPTTLNEMIKRYDIRPRRKKACATARATTRSGADGDALEPTGSDAELTDPGQRCRYRSDPSRRSYFAMITSHR